MRGASSWHACKGTNFLLFSSQNNGRPTKNESVKGDDLPRTSSMSRPYRDESLSLARGPETTYLRTVISRFGGIIRVGTSVQIPPQTWEKDAPEVNPDALSFRKRTPPEFSIVTAGVPGYRGYPPNGAPPRRPSARPPRARAAGPPR